MKPYSNEFLDSLAGTYRQAVETGHPIADYIRDVFAEIGVIHSDGGQGSGNFNHGGRPGEIGGSAPSDGSPASQESARAEGRAYQKITKRRANDEIARLAKDGDLAAVKDILDKLPNGSVVKLPDHWNDNGKGDKLKKLDDGRWECQNSDYHYVIDTDEIVHYVEGAKGDEAELPAVTSVAMTPEAMAKDLERYQNSYWRNNEQVWKKDGSFDRQETIKMRKLDLDNCGEGFEVVGSDGKTYMKTSEGWVDKETFRSADMRKLKAPEFTGDFFSVNFGMNGVSKEECEKMRQMYASFPEEVRSSYEKGFREAGYSVSFDGGACYTPWDDKIRLTGLSTAETVIHEMSHKLDRGIIDKTVDLPYYKGYHINSASVYIDHLGNSQEQRDADFEAMAKVVGYETNGKGWFGGKHVSDTGYNEDRISTYVHFAVKNSSIPGFDAVSDAMSALTQSGCGETVFGGHEPEYWRQSYGGEVSSARSSEYWANYCMLRLSGHTEALDLLKKVTPNMYAAAEETYKEAFGNGKKRDSEKKAD